MNELTIASFLILLKRKWWIVISVTSFIALIVGYINFYQLTPIYTNSTSLLVNDRNTTSNSSLRIDDVLLYEKLLGTYKDIIYSKRILKPVADILHTDLSADQLASMISVSTNTNSQVIRISANNENYTFATDLVNVIAQTFQSHLVDIMTVDNVQILDPAEKKSYPVPIKPNKLLNVVLSAFLGFLLAIGIVLSLHFMDNRLRSEEELADILSFPLIGSVTHSSNSRKPNNR